jgi:CMP-N,N'-diacetyllegionaminic acid synthase
MSTFESNTVKSRLCTINVRGGSKGVPGKNSKLLDGIPLLSHSIRQAVSTKKFDLVAVSSDSDELLEIAAKEGAEVIRRPPDLALDDSPKIPAIVHCVMGAELIWGKSFNTVVDLDATSPLRTPSDIVNAIELLEDSNLQSVFSACHSRRSPYFNLVSMDSGGKWGPAIRASNPPTRRQDSLPTYDMNASIYVWNRDDLVKSQGVFLERTGLYLMPENRSIDIDSQFDFDLVSWLISRNRKEDS